MKKAKQEKGRDDFFLDAALRPNNWNDYVGQEKIKKSLQLILEAAKKRGEPSDHLMFYGPAGVGKTTIAHLIAHETGAKLRITSGTALKKNGDMAALLSGLEANDILFIDECHRIGRSIEEMLYPAMESGELQIILGRGPGGREYSLKLPPFTLIVSTTRPDLLSSPLKSRFGASFRFDYYEPEEIVQIVHRSARLLGMEIGDTAARIIAKASRFTPRFANRLVKRGRDFAEISGKTTIGEAEAEESLKILELDELGLEKYERKLLQKLITDFGNRPVGISTLAAAIGEDRRVVEEIYEPYLIRLGFLLRNPKGRIASQKAVEYLKIPFNDSDNGGIA